MFPERGNPTSATVGAETGGGRAAEAGETGCPRAARVLGGSAGRLTGEEEQYPVARRASGLGGRTSE